MNINSLANLRGVDEIVHASIGRIWTAFRRVSRNAKAQDVQRVVDIVDRHYTGWYNKPYDVGMSPTLQQAERAALEEVEKLVQSLL